MRTGREGVSTWTFNNSLLGTILNICIHYFSKFLSSLLLCDATLSTLKKEDWAWYLYLFHIWKWNNLDYSNWLHNRCI